MEHGYMFHGHTRSMSSLASAISPIPPEPSALTSAVEENMDQDGPNDFPLELGIPLPPSNPGSQIGEEETFAEQKGSIPASSIDTRTEHGSQAASPVPPLGSDEQDASSAKGQSLPVLARSSTASLSELQSLIASERVHRERTRLLQSRLENLRLRCTLERRLLSTLASAYRLMVSQFRSKSHTEFVKIYDILENLIEQIHSFGHPADGLQPYDDSLASEEPLGTNWMDIMPSVQQESLLSFLNQLRTDTGFLASCICKLSSAELLALTSSYRPQSPIDSVLPGSHPSRNQGRPGRPAQHTDGTAIEGIQELLQSDPLFTILHGLFDESSDPENTQRTEVLSTMCARVMVEGKRGSDDLLNTILDDIFSGQPVDPQPKLEGYLLRILQDGSSVLELPPNLFGKEPVEIRNANAAIASSNFFEKCSADLFSLLADELPRIVPPRAILFVQAVLRQIEDPVLRTRAKNFMVPKWFFCSFISNILLYPESCGLMMKHHVGDTARQGLLKPLAVRMQKQVLEIVSPWGRYNLIDSSTRSAIEKIFSFFEPAKLGPVHSNKSRPSHSSHREATASLILSPHIILSLIKALSPLTPLTPPSPASTDPSSEDASTTSSIAASSTLTSGSVGYGSAVPSSLAPSLSGTSMTSTTILSEYSLMEPASGQDQADDEAANIDHRPGSSTKAISDAMSTAVLEACHSIIAALESQTSVMSNFHSSNWIVIEASGPGLRLSPSFVDDKTLGSERAPPDPSVVPETHPQKHLFDDVGIAISKAIDEKAVGSDLSFAEESSGSGISTILYSLLRSAMNACESRFDFRAAYYWWRSIQHLDELSRLEGPETACTVVMNHLVGQKIAAIDRSTEAIGLLGSKVHHLDMLVARQKRQLEAVESRRRALRDKFWYVSDVKHSKVYEDILLVTQALRVMADSKRVSKRPSAMTHWAKQRLRTSDSHNRTSAVALEALASPKEYGGLSKLADSQVETTTRWMTKNSIENFCKGEEIIHRFCHEVQKCVDKLAGANILDSPVLWSSDLFKHERALFNTRRTASSVVQGGKSSNDSRRTITKPHPLSFNAPASVLSNPLAAHGLVGSTPKSINGFWQATKPSSQFLEGIPYFKQTQHISTKNPIPGLPPFTDSNLNSRLSFAREGLPSHSTREASKAQQAFANHIKAAVTAFLLSDLGHVLWNQGSETDLWIYENNPREDAAQSHSPLHVSRAVEPVSMASTSALSDALSDSTITVHYEKLEDKTPTPPVHLHKSNPAKPDSAPQAPPFAFSNAFANVLRNFSSSADPLVKLEMLVELEALARFSIDSVNRSRKLEDSARAALNGEITTNSALRSQGLNIPRTKATSLEEVVANCTERRAGTVKFTYTNSSSRRNLGQTFDPPDTDAVVNALLEIFRDDGLRPRTLYRDLQFIATFVPSSILDQSAKGKAFWDVGLAALAYKEERCGALIRRANQITNYHVSANKDTSSFVNAYSADLVDTTLGDAAQLWVTIAKEGSPVACRELGLFYLTHPELLPRITLPLSKSKDVFKSVTSSDRTSIETGGLDPLTFAVVFHWMELAANGGDKDARDFIRGSGELSNARS